MAKELKVYGLIVWVSNLRGQRRAIVATTSQAAAAEAMGVGLSELRIHGSPTRNEIEIEAAMAQPGVALFGNGPTHHSRTVADYVSRDQVL